MEFPRLIFSWVVSSSSLSELESLCLNEASLEAVTMKYFLKLSVSMSFLNFIACVKFSNASLKFREAISSLTFL